MAKPIQILQIEPPVEISFKGPFTDVVTSQIKLTNPSEKAVCFKVKTTALKQYCVRPNSGLILPHGTTSVSVMLQPFDNNSEETNKHKFMVQTTYVPEGEQSLDDIWKNVPANEIMNSKLRVKFDTPKLNFIEKIVQNSTKAQAKTGQIIDQQLRNTGSSALGTANHRITLRDLRTKIKYCTMSGAAEMASKLTEIIDESREVEDSLQKLEAKTRSSFANLINANTYALKMVKAYTESDCNANELQDTYSRMMNIIGSDLKKLITAATDSLGRLRNMDELMSVMYDMGTHESKMHDITRKNFLTRIWYHFGNNVGMKENIALLTNYEQWHKSATAFVTTTYSILRSFQVDMEELRGSVEEYNLVQNLPIELHIENIRKSIERLQKAKAAQRSGVPLAEISEELKLIV